MVNTIIFDVGMVLVNYRWKDYIEEFQFPDEVKEAVIKATFLSEEWNEFDRSLLSDEEILNSFIEHAPEYEKEINQVFENLSNIIITYEYTDAWIKELKKEGYKVYILSNYPRKTYELTKEQLSFVNLCDGALFSFEVNKIKPEPEIFQILSERFAIQPEEAVFLDDNSNNIEAAKEFGFHTIHFTTKEKAVQELSKFFR